MEIRWCQITMIRPGGARKTYEKFLQFKNKVGIWEQMDLVPCAKDTPLKKITIDYEDRLTEKFRIAIGND